MLVIIPPNRPAQVLLGLIFGANFTPPTSAPNMNAPISVATTEARIQKKYSNSTLNLNQTIEIHDKSTSRLPNKLLATTLNFLIKKVKITNNTAKKGRCMAEKSVYKKIPKISVIRKTIMSVPIL